MKILVANLGSTSFKYALYDMTDERVLARGRVERIGEASSPCTLQIGETVRALDAKVPDHAVAVRQCLSQLTEPGFGPLKDESEVSAIGFKAVHAAGASGIRRVNDELLAAMEEFNDLMPAHNPPYVRAMRLLSEKLPEIPLIAAFETEFHLSIPDRNRYYGIPLRWAIKYHILRWGFHGASHRYIATRTAELLERDDLRIISMHLGGSSSLCAIKNGKSVATSMGASAQTGLLHNNRCGDFDPFALPYLMRKTSKSLEEILEILSTQSGLLGLSGIGSDIRDIIEAGKLGDFRSHLALEVLVGDIRRYLGAYLVELGGADVLVFTAGIGENNHGLRSAVCTNLHEFGIILHPDKNEAAIAKEAPIHSVSSKVQVWVIPTNEELVVARQTKEYLDKGSTA